ncbi:MAG TPA: polysaccharide deacetylase family protein [Thermomicrobiales bacterium]|nr:polysaccharide deacetylase family protein [Thermomicrobiales bacterium]
MISKIDMAANAFRWFGGDVISRNAPFGDGILVFNYHRIGTASESEFDRDVFSTTADQFDEQMDFLKRNFDVISPHDLPAARRQGKGRYVLITFDDGYIDNYHTAFPILKRHGLPATFFIPTGFIDRRDLSWWDTIAWMIRHSDARQIPASDWFEAPLPMTGDAREFAIRQALKTYKRLPGRDTDNYVSFLAEATGHATLPTHLGDDLWMSWNNIRELRLAGMTIGGHTVNHPLLARLTSTEQIAEIRGSRERLQEMLGAAPKAFAYPVGKPDTFTTITRAILLSTGFEYAFSFYGGYQNLIDIDLLDIRRVNVGRRTSQSLFEMLSSMPSVFARFA